MTEENIKALIEAVDKEILQEQENGKNEINGLLEEYRKIEKQIQDRGIEIHNKILKMQGRKEAYEQMLNGQTNQSAS